MPCRYNPDLSDPRPQKYRGIAGYNDYVSNILTNYCALTSADLSFKYMKPKAFINFAVLDHDYLDLPFTEYWIDAAQNVSDRDIARIEHRTRKQNLSKVWHQEREWHLTASRFGDICKATDPCNRLKLCSSIFKPLKLKTPAVLNGQQYEAVARQTFQEKMGFKVKTCGLFIDSENNYLAASPDGIIGENAIVEIKCPYKGRDRKIAADKFFPFLLEDDDGVLHLKQNHNYYMQVQGQLNVCKKEKCFFVVYTFVDIFVEEINVDRVYFCGCMLPKLELFYKKHYRKFLAEKL
ncbi:uncharacterized protein LOC133198798 isoform X1 [Saccostrea echinata]|uniref:uncharacterized protein LOC133198798 isoform X1 n=1 Tax=Saccostrea echinata TaxID=191078 RepID=UPI002A7EF4B8|nr:uncharacterized protein LOC133198798 isoform X1 [Saccostrea echinata]